MLRKFLLSTTFIQLIGKKLWRKKYCFIVFAAKHPNLWNYRPIASYLGRMKTFVLSQCKSDFVKLDKISMTLPENEFLHLGNPLHV